MNKKRNIIGVLGLPLNKKGEFLVTYRQDSKPEVHNKWQVAGGKMEFGETAPETVMRELKEELGVSSRIVCKYPILESQTWDFKERQVHVLLITYIVDIGDQTITLNEEANAYKWVTSKTLDVNNSLRATLPILTDAEQLVRDFALVSKLG